MTQTILAFPVRHTVLSNRVLMRASMHVSTPVLIRVWCKTGNPACPLASRWIASEDAGRGVDSVSAPDRQICRLCA